MADEACHMAAADSRTPSCAGKDNFRAKTTVHLTEAIDMSVMYRNAPMTKMAVANRRRVG
jgi:hypothetical protein